MKTCPYCAEEIQDAAIKCRYCGEFLDRSRVPAPLPQPKRPKEPWYQSTPVIVVAILMVGPLALPLVWIHPQYRTTTKVLITAGMLVLTYGLAIIIQRQIAYLWDILDQINAVSNHRR